MKKKDAEVYLVDEDLHCIPNAHGSGASTAVVFVHGFTGDGIETWGEFPERLRDDVDLAGFDFLFWGYPTKLNPVELVTREFWSEDPSIELIGKSLRTVFETQLGDYDRLMLVAHSMGGLAVQTFVIEEIERNATEHLDRLAEIVLYATPSGGLELARWFGFFKRQVADMSRIDPFIEKLRAAWQVHVDKRRADEDRLARFRLTLVAGQRDKFVPEESSLKPFPLDEHVVVPGNHIQLVKPEKSGQRTVDVLKERLLRGNPTKEELRVLNGESPRAIEVLAKIRGAESLGEAAALGEIADDLLGEGVQLPMVEGALALVLSGQRDHGRAVKLFDRYLGFEMSDGRQPFAQDAYAVQQLAVSLSALGDNMQAVQRLEQLPEDIRADSETMGIRAGRAKRQWLEERTNLTAGRSAFQTYRAAFENAKAQRDIGQSLYNGINTAFMSLMLGLPHEPLAEEVLDIAVNSPAPDYWTIATRAEALLLLQRFDEARDQYAVAFVEAETPRYLATTAAQALNIIDRLGNPDEAAGIKELIEENYVSLEDAIADQEAESESKELAD